MLKFPAEVLDSIIDHLDQRDVCVLLSVSIEVNAVVTSRARSRLELHEDDGGHVVVSAHGSNVHSLRRGWLPNMVTSLDLHSELQDHLAMDFDGLLDPLQIRLLRLRHADSEFSPSESRLRGTRYECQTGIAPCMFTTLRPRTVVVHGFEDGLDKIPTAQSRCLQGMFCHVAHLAVVYPIGPTLFKTPTVMYARAEIPALTEFTIVFPSVPGQYWQPTVTDRSLSQWLERQLRLFVVMVVTVNSNDFRLTIVNAGSIHPDCLEYGYDHDTAAEGRADRQAHLEHIFFGNLWDTCVPRKLGKKELARFCSMEEWIAEGSADGILDEEEIAPWLEVA